MPAILRSGLFAAFIIVIALLAAFDAVPQQVAEYTVLTMPILASAAIIGRERACCVGVRT